MEPVTKTQPTTGSSDWTRLTSGTDHDWRVPLLWLSGLGYNRAAPTELLVRLLDIGETSMLYRHDLPDGVMDAAITHPREDVRADVVTICGRRLSPDQAERLSGASPEPALRERLTGLAADSAVARRMRRGVEPAPEPHAAPPTTPAEIAAMAAEVPDIAPDRLTTALWWIGALHENPDAMRQLAASPKLLVRRSVARAPRLPADVVDLLARDEDDVVQLFLAESCDDAPPEMLLAVAGWWNGSFSFPGRPLNHPNFPRAGLLRFATDPNPRLRALAHHDPASTPADVERAAGDPHETVRRAAAEDHRLAAETAIILAGDPEDGVRLRAWTNPALPPHALVPLLLALRSAEMAVKNPGIPVPVMHRLVDYATPLLHAAERRAEERKAAGPS